MASLPPLVTSDALPGTARLCCLCSYGCFGELMVKPVLSAFLACMLRDASFFARGMFCHSAPMTCCSATAICLLKKRK